MLKKVLLNQDFIIKSLKILIVNYLRTFAELFQI